MYPPPAAIAGISERGHEGASLPYFADNLRNL
jgi:hypothetical protein